ncbi:hypothetical protein BDK88_3948 [Natrinema hispanicum]|uniref:Uncharacterized protein n=1 Tax=Natrinema hispanicum TaxID=392421 RepID=A0A482Y894_9EURY|nr:hypothetical protein BDK88_3948 [Natrinema hispanicum]
MLVVSMSTLRKLDSDWHGHRNSPKGGGKYHIYIGNTPCDTGQFY